ncbi:hypothetical protein L3X38_010083 [Prunus dulcis]|uniref:Uncharacterized protein n=1 Tax=Prunus dulcis TaxID=3755 RepID=A0AAD4WFR0_PRUDU|nr:hypothetical protein L3X38_010083 [Prunus dulcis]
MVHGCTWCTIEGAVNYGDEKGGGISGQGNDHRRSRYIKPNQKSIEVMLSLNQVEEVKLVLRLIPIWLSCLMFGVIQAQLHTFFTNKVAQQSYQSVPISKSLQHHFKDLLALPS